jgi:OmpA-OmpF porin, OOP family
MFILNYKSAASLALAFSLSGCVATRKHVKNVSDPLDRRIGGLEAKNREVEVKLETHEKGITAADERAKAADQHAADAAKDAKGAHERITQVGEQTTAVSKTATEARSVADQGLGKAVAVDQRLTQSLASMDKFQLLTTQSVLFAVAKSSLTPEATKMLDEAAAEALKHNRFVIEVQGFTDKTGSADANLALSRMRADEVVRYLTMQHKIPLYRVYQLGAGELVPVADDKTREGRKQNRRVEVKVYSAEVDGTKVTASASR